MRIEPQSNISSQTSTQAHQYVPILRGGHYKNTSVPLPSGVPEPQLKYYGGKLLKKPSFASIYLGSFWQSRNGKSEMNYHNDFAKQFVKGKHTTIWGQYGVGKGEFLGSRLLAPPRTPRIVNDSLVQRIVREQIQQAPFSKANDQTVYTVYLPPGTVLKAPGGESSLDGVGGYHYSFDLAPNKRVYYSVLVYSKDQNGIDFTGDPKSNLTITASHEWTEAVTDPDVNRGKLGWYDYRYGEVSDIPLSMGIPLDKTHEKQNGYEVQEEWSVKDHRFEVEAK